MVWALLFFLMAPSTMALASWNAVPGDFTYSWKLSLEKVTLVALSPFSKLQSETQMKITERRMAEVNQVIYGDYAVEGLQNLNQQVIDTQVSLTKIKQAEAKQELIDQYLAYLRQISTDLDVQKEQIDRDQTAVAANGVVTPAPTKAKNSRPTVVAQRGQLSSAPPVVQQNITQVIQVVNTTVVVQQIEQTQQQINQTITELETQQQNLPPPPTPTPLPPTATPTATPVPNRPASSQGDGTSGGGLGNQMQSAGDNQNSGADNGSTLLQQEIENTDKSPTPATNVESSPTLAP